MEYKNREDYDKNHKYIWKEDCCFCDENLDNTNKVLYMTKHWIVVYNKYPYFWDEKNILTFPKRHIEFSIELNDEELLDYINVEKYISDFYENDEYFSLTRQSRSNKSVEHLHYHYIRWIPSNRIIDWENYFKIKKE